MKAAKTWRGIIAGNASVHVILHRLAAFAKDDVPIFGQYAVHCAVGFAVTLKWITRRLSCACTSMTKSTLKPTVGTVKKSIDTSSVTWFFRNDRHVGEGGLRWRTRYFSTVDFAI